MEQALVTVLEDDPNIRLLIRMTLHGGPHDIAQEGETVPECYSAIDKIASGEVKSNVVLMDGNYSRKERYGKEGAALVQYVRDKGLRAWLIGISAQVMEDLGIKVDYDLGKDRIATDLERILDELEEP